jgi:hypothetical protein
MDGYVGLVRRVEDGGQKARESESSGQKDERRSAARRKQRRLFGQDLQDLQDKARTKGL